MVSRSFTLPSSCVIGERGSITPRGFLKYLCLAVPLSHTLKQRTCIPRVVPRLDDDTLLPQQAVLGCVSSLPNVTQLELRIVSDGMLLRLEAGNEHGAVSGALPCCATGWVHARTQIFGLPMDPFHTPVALWHDSGFYVMAAAAAGQIFVFHVGTGKVRLFSYSQPGFSKIRIQAQNQESVYVPSSESRDTLIFCVVIQMRFTLGAART